MKPKYNNPFLARLQQGRTLAGLGTLLLTSGVATAATAYWDTNGVTAGSGREARLCGSLDPARILAPEHQAEAVVAMRVALGAALRQQRGDAVIDALLRRVCDDVKQQSLSDEQPRARGRAIRRLERARLDRGEHCVRALATQRPAHEGLELLPHW